MKCPENVRHTSSFTVIQRPCGSEILRMQDLDILLTAGGHADVD